MVNNNTENKSSGGKYLGNKTDNKYYNYDDFKYTIKPVNYSNCNKINQTEAVPETGADHGCGFHMHSFAATSKLYDDSGHWKNKSFVECESMPTMRNWKDNVGKLHLLEDFQKMKFFSNMKIFLKLLSKKCLNFNIGLRKTNLLSSSSASSCYSNAKVLRNIVDVPIKKRNYQLNKRRPSFIPSLGSTSFITILAFICLETILLSTMSTCAKTFYMHWNTSNSIFRIDNTDHIIDVNKGNLAFEFDQVHIICPVYEPGSFENETEKYIIYNVSKVEYETCRITNADPRVIAICDKPNKLMFFTITFRPFTPQPGGLEFLPGNDYYFISTSSKDDLYRRIGGRCSTNNMKVVFKVCCSAEEKNKTIAATTKTSAINNSGVENGKTNQLGLNIDGASIINNNNGNPVNTGLSPNGFLNSNGDTNNVNIKPINGIKDGSSLDQFNRIPIQTVGVNSGVGFGNHATNGILLTPGHGSINMIPNGGLSNTGIGQYPGFHSPGGIRINNMPPQQNYPPRKSTNDDHYEKHPNEVVKNEELTYNSGTSSLHSAYWSRIGSTAYQFVTILINKSLFTIFMLSKHFQYLKILLIIEFNPYRLIFLFALLLIFLLSMWRHHHNFRSKSKFSYFRNEFSDTFSKPSTKFNKNKSEFTKVR